MKTKGQKLLTAKLMIDRIPTDAIRASHAANREGLRQNMEVLSRGELIEKFFILFMRKWLERYKSLSLKCPGLTIRIC